MTIKFPETIPLGTAVMLVARQHAKRLAKDYPEGSREGQARAAVNTALVELGVDVGDDWQELEALAPHRAWSRAVMQAAAVPDNVEASRMRLMTKFGPGGPRHVPDAVVED